MICADHFASHVYLLSPFYFALIFSTLAMATLYVTDVTRSVLLFFGILRCVGYGLSVCDALLRECIAMLSRIFLPPPASNGAWHPTYDRPISLYLPHVSHQLQAPRIMSRTHVDAIHHVPVFWLEILVRHARYFTLCAFITWFFVHSTSRST